MRSQPCLCIEFLYLHLIADRSNRGLAHEYFTRYSPEGREPRGYVRARWCSFPAVRFAWDRTNTIRKRRPAHRVTVGAFWMDRYPVTNRQFMEFVKATGHVTFAEIPPDPKDYPGALPQCSMPDRSFFLHQRARSICATGVSGGCSSRAQTGATPTARRAISTGSTIIQWRTWRLPTRSLTRMGWQELADRGGMGIRRAWRARRRRICLGRRVHARRQAHGQYLAGRVSVP